MVKKLLLIYIIGHTMYKVAICDFNNKNKEDEAV